MSLEGYWIGSGWKPVWVRYYWKVDCPWFWGEESSRAPMDRSVRTARLRLLSFLV
jgi:hypothetical protein